ncbi:choice-of-anchor J domain-containing protein [Hymenobacter sp. H14-R3]|uniref:T9SS-dependent choice-of-anchor J family protein n=1 Tax=Hymenobacter sp. H14-R3 TaxID=3046308 RepID=UPI0024BB364D|nr:choice-of-anchor J domain-containing protein [Hymenobacter sp. H14-R3]MDJ0366096.1 choice-of-anchor J domain-containing protein [Hymenobacter sp. H14-R3]
MTRKLLTFGWASVLALTAFGAQAQATLGTSPYTENFNTLASGLPTGFSVYTAATPAALGTAGTLVAAATSWTDSGAGFKNFASATDLTAAATTAAQAAATNRALGVRQTGPTDAGVAFVFRALNTTGKTDLALTFKLQSLDNASPRVTTWQVDYAVGATPTSFTTTGSSATTGGTTFSNNTVTVSFNGALDNQTGPVWVRITALNGTTGTGARASSAIDDFSLSWNANANAPVLTATPATLAFGKQNINTPSATQTYTLTGANLTGATTVTTAAPFSLSKDGSTAFGTSLTYTAAELTSARPVYVRFTPTTLALASGAVTGTITNTSDGATARTVTVTGSGIDPTQTVYDFNACTGTTTLSDGWVQTSVTGPQMWACTTFGRDPMAPAGTAPYPSAVQMNGYAAANIENEDWLISPVLDLSTYTYPLLSFWSRTAFNGPSLKLRVSTNYAGTGAPSAATWTDLSVAFPAGGSDTWTQTANINLAAFKGATVYVAFVYTSTSMAAARWTLDDIALTKSATPPAPTVLTNVNRLAFGYQAINTSSTQALNVSANDLTADVTVASSDANYTVSKDGTNFASTVTLTKAEVNALSKPVTVRFLPTVALASISGMLTVSSAGATAQTVALSGDTYDPAKTLEVVNWNMEWFGSADATLGPKDKNLQNTNATAVLNFLKADVYALEEVVDTVRLRAIATNLSTTLGVPYAYKISPYGSRGDNQQDPEYIGDQKLAFIYRTDMVKNPSFQGLLRCSEADACPAYTPWASGRFPWQMRADVTLDGVTKKVDFVVIHAKANATASSANDYARRKTGADLLKGLLDTSYGNDNTLIVGDYNDILEGTIATGVTPAVSSYSSFLNDINYVPLTLPLAQAGLQSTASFKTVIDHVIANKNMARYYINGTAAIRTDVAAQITNYSTTTSDHYPIFTRYSFTGTMLASKSARAASLGLYPNPVANSVRFEVPETGNSLSLSVYTTTGSLVLRGTGSVEQLNQQLSQRVAGLAAGLYVVRVVGAQQTYTDRFEKQ